jgi:drug/metabolite transporter (DMT)-like permease
VTARDWTGFFGLAVLWGIPYLFIKIAVDDGIPPVFLAWVRVTLAAAVLLALAARAGTIGSVRGHGRWIAGYAVIEICLPFPLIAAGELHVSSSLAAILIAAVPSFVALLSLRFMPAERLTRGRALGLAIGFAGVVALVGIDVAGDRDELLGAGAILLAAFGYACGPMIYQRRFATFDVRAAMGWSLLAAAVVLAPFAALDPPQEVTTDAAAAILVLSFACTAAAFALFAVLVTTIGAARTAIITYVAPIVALAAGVAVLDERVGPGTLVGLALILSGSWLATRPASKAVGAADDLPHDLVGATPDRPQARVP